MHTRTLSRPSRWVAAALLSLGVGAGTLALPSRAEAADVQVRVLVDVADLIFRSGRPYYYDRGYGHYQPVVVEYDRWRRPHYYRYAPRPVVVHAPPPRYYAPPRHYAPSPYYRAGYAYRDRDDRRRWDDRRGGHGRWDRDDGHRHDNRGRGRGHDHGRGRGHDD